MIESVSEVLPKVGRICGSASLTYVVGSLVGALILGMAAALVLNNAGATGTVLRVFILFPWTLSMSVVGSIWLWLVNPSFGPIPYLIQVIGLDPGLMLGDPGLALPLIIIVTAWWSFPYVMVMATAAMQSIPNELYEAVEIDGGGALISWRNRWSWRGARPRRVLP